MTRQGPVMLIRVMLTRRQCTFLGGGDRVQTYTTSLTDTFEISMWSKRWSTAQIVSWWVLHPIIVLSCTQSKHCCFEEDIPRISTNQVVVSVNTISAKGSELNAVCRCVIEIYLDTFSPPHKAVTWSTWLDISLFGLLVRLKTHLGTSQLLGNSQHKIYEKNRTGHNETSPRTMNEQKLPHTPVHL